MLVMPWFVEFPRGMPRSIEAERGVRSTKEERSCVGLDMAALSIAGECLSGESIPPRTFPNSVQIEELLCSP